MNASYNPNRRLRTSERRGDPEFEELAAMLPGWEPERAYEDEEDGEPIDEFDEFDLVSGASD